MHLKKLTVVALSACFGLSACQKEEAPPAAPPASEAPAPARAESAPQQPVESMPPATATAPGSGSNLIREPVAAQEQPLQAIQTKMGPKESVIHLTSAKVTGQILTVEFVAVPKKRGDGRYEWLNLTLPLKNVSYIDDATAKKVSLLQDDGEAYMASPLNGTGKSIRLDGHSPITATLKFPAPPETSPTISVNFSDIGSFDGVPVSR
ncbi:phosphoribosylglycinamide synthetase [Uruburuella testudinis]|uniref:Phosphoribosylglycinamide synthetase n=1 Tax=Uruburuella testudinis TaxID=1282863 RepID=A0ABY4DXQ6_9NEIS|nr:phosphoribosylglycinamide synthetase [Uruburuella testudinis]UOO82854.1 phosphoribosylglycinamide synthetase [Uruburuella testudinis]